MDAIKLNLPIGSTVIGELLQDYSRNSGRLTEDIMQISLPSGQAIDVGWSPEFDASGHFNINVLDGDWDDGAIESTDASTPYEAQIKIQEIAFRLAVPKPVKNSKDIHTAPHPANTHRRQRSR